MRLRKKLNSVNDHSINVNRAVSFFYLFRLDPIPLDFIKYMAKTKTTKECFERKHCFVDQQLLLNASFCWMTTIHSRHLQLLRNTCEDFHRFEMSWHWSCIGKRTLSKIASLGILMHCGTARKNYKL